MQYEIEIQGLDELQRAFSRAPEVTLTQVRQATDRTLLDHQGTAKNLAPVDHGRLRQGIVVESAQVMGSTVEGKVKATAKYACIFNGHTSITTDKGSKEICQIRVGDMVLTQAGDYQPVTAKHVFPALEKPDLIDIEVAWRKGKTHKITVTTDHKILTFRSGRNKWIRAGELTVDDLLYRRKKISPIKGTARQKLCAGCNQWFTGGNRVYCSLQCKVNHWNQGANPHTGMKRSEATREAFRLLNLQRLQTNPEKQINRILAQRGYRSQYEIAVQEWLDTREVDYVQQWYVNGSFADFYIPDSNTVIEADGAYWHQDQNRDIKRDARMKTGMENLTIVHLHFFEERFSPALDLNPMEGVFYVPCNPGPDTFTDPEQFETAQIISLRPWRYGVKKSKFDARRASLYDLTVANVHSFFANGILVSNSHQELGTGVYGPTGQPIRPRRKKMLAWKKNGQWIFARQVKGSRPRHFFKGAVEQNRDSTNRHYSQALEEITRQLSR